LRGPRGVPREPGVRPVRVRRAGPADCGHPCRRHRGREWQTRLERRPPLTRIYARGMADESWARVDTPEELTAALDGVGYLADRGLATAAFLAVRMGRPLFCEGEPGTGKTSLAVALAGALDVPLIRLQCHEGIDTAQALYDWDFPRQLLHLRTLEATAAGTPGGLDAEQAEASLYTPRFLLARPLLRALREAPCVLLVDEVDRADDEFEA